ncbi:MAG: hypothetical protein AB7J19_08945, partial [Beijerinckiaceae bacterium]
GTGVLQKGRPSGRLFLLPVIGACDVGSAREAGDTQKPARTDGFAMAGLKVADLKKAGLKVAGSNTA